jgi:hypothetical protein
MIAYADDPTGFFAPDCVRQPYVRVEGGLNFRAAKYRE